MSLNNLKTEIAILIKNNDIMTTTERNVITQTDEITLDNESEIIIDRTNIKNIRSIVINSVSLVYGKDYTVNYDYLDTNIKCKITLSQNYTDTATVTYDYGSDKIFTDMARKDLTLSSYPRISIEQVSKSTENFSLGGEDFINSEIYQVVVFSENEEYVEDHIKSIETLFKNNAKNLYYAKYIKPTGQGPVIKTPNRSNTIISKNIDLMSQFEVD